MAGFKRMVQPKIGLSMLYCLGEPFNKMLRQIAKMEVVNIELVDEGLHELNKRRVLSLKDLGSSYSFKYSVHAPFADINIASPSKPMLRATISRLQRSIAHASALNAHVWVFHPGMRTGVSMFYPNMEWRQNCGSARQLCKIAEDYGVKIAVENMPVPYPFIMKRVEEFRRFFEEVGDLVGLALDVGHSNLNGQTEQFLRVFKNKIRHVHVSDNDGRNDLHLGIGYGSVDWRRFAEEMRAISYDQILIVESVEHVKESLQRLEQLFT
ncbi:MAG: sugar phosphate isomerase/epimerase family protein [Candidatus Bathycorpusculaceae bacterium]